MTHPQDRALVAVRRVRAARERDSRIGLQQALVAARTRADEAAAAQQRLRQAPAFAEGSATDLHVHVLHTRLLAADAHAAAERAEAGRLLTEEASAHWQRDRSALRVAELLLERRAEERAAERDRREARALDDLAAQGWLRGRTAGEASR